jgi:hypothetical protein
MSPLVLRKPRLISKFVFPSSTSNLSPTYEMMITPPEAEFVHLENAHRHSPDNCRDLAPGDKRQRASARGAL